MARTPEGEVKKRVRALLDKHGVYYDMPVPHGYGKPTLDFVACHRGQYLAIETKANGAKPTARQRNTITQMFAAGAAVFVVDDDPATLEALREWLCSVSSTTAS